jgi:hypothetical protein
MPTPNSISSNTTGLAYAEEAVLKTVSPGPWYALEPNSYTDLGAAFSTVKRTPITNTRQRAKGTISDLDAKASFNSDLTQRNLTRLMQGFFYADAIEKPATNPLNGAQVVFTSVAAPAVNKFNAAAGLGGFLTNHLVFAKNFGASANNGLHKAIATAAGFVQVAEALVAEAAPPAAASLEAVGYEFPAGDLALTIVGNTVILTSATIDPATLGLTIGEWLFVGGDAVGNQFALNLAGFYGRVLSWSTALKQIVFDLTTTTPVADAGAAKSIRIFFGKVLLNSVNPVNIKRRSYTIERQLGNDGVGNQAEYVLGAVPNEFTLNIKQAAKIDCDLAFVGMDVQYNDGVAGLQAGARVASPFEDAFNTSHDVASLRIAAIDPATSNPSAAFAYATDLKLTIKNNVSGNKALAVLGSFEANVGGFDVEGTATAYFQKVAGQKAIRSNADVCLTAILAKKNAGMVFDIPLLQLGNGANKVEGDKPITTDLTQSAAKCATGYTFLMNVWEYLPTVAIPA